MKKVIIIDNQFKDQETKMEAYVDDVCEYLAEWFTDGLPEGTQIYHGENPSEETNIILRTPENIECLKQSDGVFYLFIRV